MGVRKWAVRVKGLKKRIRIGESNVFIAVQCCNETASMNDMHFDLIDITASPFTIAGTSNGYYMYRMNPTYMKLYMEDFFSELSAYLDASRKAGL